MPPTTPSPLRPRCHAVALEPRLLFDGAAAVAVVENAAETPDKCAQDVGAACAERDSSGSAHAQDAHAEAGAQSVLVVVDSRVDGWQSLVAELPANAMLRVIDQGESGIAAISEALAGRTGIQSIQIYSHGSQGSLTIGTSTLTTANINERAAELHGWGQHLSSGADILLFGCDIASGQGGAEFISRMASLTGADVAASTNPTGAAARGGDWTLEAATGSIEAQAVLGAAQRDGYSSLLAATAITDAKATASHSGAEDTEFAVEGLAVSDADNPASMTLQIQSTGGTARIADLHGTTISAGANGSADFTISGSLGQINDALATLKYTGAQDQNSATTGFAPKITLTAKDVTNGGAATYEVTNLAVTPVNDAPYLGSGVALEVKEGASAHFGLAQLATSAGVLDPDILTGQQVLEQQMMILTSLPTHGVLTYKGGAVAVGTVIPVSELASLLYTHNGSDVTAPDTFTDSFGVTVNDGGGGSTSATLSVNLAPVNKAPAISGSFTLYEGQVMSVVPTIDLGDAADSLATSVITIDSVVTGGQGSFFIDANGDNKADEGEIVTGTRTVTAAQLAQLKFAQNGYEPNTPGAVSPSFRTSVTDSGGGAKKSDGSADKFTTAQTFTLTVLPNNDDPTLTNTHANSGSALAVDEGETKLFTGDMLTIHDADRNPANPSQTTPTGQLVYTIGARPTQGEIQLYVGGTLGPNSDGWVVLGDGGRFTQADIDAGRVRYYQTTEVPGTTGDSFTFTVRDSSSGLDVWTDPADPTGPREGGLRNAPTDAALAVQTFHLSIDAIAGSHDNTYTGGPRPATSGYGGENMKYDFHKDVATIGNGAATWNESNVDALGGGYVITDSMLAYTITRTDTKGTPETGDDVSVTLPPEQTVYTLTSLPANGSLQRFVDGAWQTLSTYATFTQADINDEHIRFVSDGGEIHASSFGYRVSDGTPNHHDGVFSIDVTPVNDRPTASGGEVKVAEGNGNAVRLGTGMLGMSDVDGSTTGAGGEGVADFLWFSVDTASVTHGKLQRWDGSDWKDVADGEWLPSSLLTASVGGETSGLRYVHDGSEPLAYATVGLVSFTYRVRDDLSNPGNSFAMDKTTPVPDVSGTPQSNLSAAATATIRVIPVNDAPQVANKPGDLDPHIDATIDGGGVFDGANNILFVREGATTTITSAHLTAIDPDNTTVQRQFKITSAPTQGVLLLNGKQIGVGSTFTQADIDSDKLSYKHSGDEVGAPTTDGLGIYHDKFLFDVSDGAATDSGNAFLISLTPANDAPTVKASAPSLDVTAAGGAYVNVPSGTFTVGDPDLVAVVDGETDFLRVEVKMVDSGGALVAGGLITYAAADPTGGNAWVDGKGTNTLVVQGTKAQVQAVLDSLKVGNTNDRDTATDKLVVTVDDRLYDNVGVLTGGANGGPLNQDGTTPDNTHNRAETSITLYSSNENDAPSITNSTLSRTATEDTALTLGGFTLSDVDSFDKQVTVTVEVFKDAARTEPATEGNLISAGGTGVTVTGSGSNTLTLTGTMAQVQAALNAVKFQAATDVNDKPFYIRATFTDYAHADGSKTASVNIDITTVTPVNDKPVLTVPGSPLLLSGGDSIAVTGIIFQDDKDLNQGALDSFTVTIAAPVAGDVLWATATGTAGVSFDSATRVLTITGTQADVNATLATLKYTPNNPNVDGTRVLSVLVNDHENGKEVTGVGGNNTASGTVEVFISSVNDPAKITASDVIVAEGASGATVVLNASKGNFNVTDADNNGGQVSATVTVSKGTITAVGGSGGTVAGTGTATVTITGATLDQLNARLQALTITYPGGNADWNGSFDVTVKVNDGGHVGSRPASLTGDTNNPKADFGDYDYADGTSSNLVTTRTITVTVTPVNDRPTLTGGAGATLPGVAEDTLDPSGKSVADLFGSKFSDAKDAVPGGSSANAMLGIAVTANAATSAQGVWQYSTNGVDWTDMPAVANNNALFLNNSDLVRFKPAADYHGAPGGLTARLVDDSGGAKTSGTTIDATTSTACSDASNAVTLGVSVTPVNDAPTLSGTVPLTTAEDTASTGKSAASILGGLTYSDAKDNRSGIPGGGDTATPGSALAIVGNAATSAQGTWQYTLNGGATWTDVPAGVGDASAIVLSTGDANHQVRFVPAADYNGAPGQLTLRAADGTWDGQTGVRDISGDKGGDKAWSASTGALGVTVTPVNDPAKISAGNVTVTEGASGATVLLDASAGGFTVTDIDNGGGLVSATVTVSKGTISAVGGSGGTVAGTGTATVTISGVTLAELNARLQALTITYPGGNADWNGSFGVTVEVNDGGHGGSRPASLTGDTNNPSADPGDYGYKDGTTSQLTTTRTITVTVTPVNDAPTLGGLGAQGYTEGAAPTAIGAGLTLGDPELGALAGGAGDWGGATLTVSRQGGANAQDVFSASGGLSALTPGSTLSDGGTVIGTVTANSGGTLTITFASGVTTAQAQAAMEKIAYSNTKTSLALGASENLTLDWVLNDQNSNTSGSGTAGGGQDQGSGGRLLTTISQTITLTGANSPPVATGDGPITAEAGKEIASIPVLSNDSDPDGDALSVTGINGVPVVSGGGVDIPEGRVTLNADGTLRFTPGPGAKAGEITFSYTISDGNGGTSTAQVTLRITAPEVVIAPPAPFAPPPPPELQAKAPLVQESSVREPSVFLDGGAVDRVMRMPIPLHPVTYVNNQVNMAQEEREGNDARMFGSPDMAAPGVPGSLSIGRGLGMDHSLFVTPEVRWSQDQGERLHNRVQGRDGRVTLTSDWRIGAAQSGQPVPPERTPNADAGEAARPDQDGAEEPERGDQPGGDRAAAPNASGQRPRTAAPSFSDQVRRAASRPAFSPRPGAPARVSI